MKGCVCYAKSEEGLRIAPLRGLKGNGSIFTRTQEELAKHVDFKTEVEKTEQPLFDNVDMYQVKT